jgi:hypothetical protein
MDADQLARVISSSMTVSDKIRALAAAGYPRADIARALGKRYQHVRNVLEADSVRLAGLPSGVAETGAPFSGRHVAEDVEERSSGAYRLVVREDGSVVLPDLVRQAFDISGRGAVMARLEGDEFKLISLATAMKRVDALMAPYRWTGGPLASDELIAERRAEAARESDD